jgi:TPR repeat protein
MSSDEQNGAALTPVHRAGLSNAGAKSLAVRGRAHLRDKEEAEEWLRKGLELQKAAPPSHWPPGPINPYAAPQPALSAELQRIKEQEEREQLRKRDEMLKEAFRCFESGLELDPINPKLLYWLAHSYHRGFGVLENEKKSVAIFQWAADLGDAGAQIEIGDAHNQRGFRCLPKDEKRAARWYKAAEEGYKAAAEQGDVEALEIIVVLYQNGIEVEQNHVEAARLLRQAAAKGVEYARDTLRDSAEFYGYPYSDDNGEAR